MVPAAALEVRGLSKRYGELSALDGVDLAVAPGEIRGLLGPNGAGKTTLLRSLLGLVFADEGTITVFGRPLEDPTAHASLAGVVEDPSFYPYLSARANLEILAELDSGDAPARVTPALERVGLAARARDRVATYSTGMRQRLGLAACLLRAPRLLLLDEPSAGLDPAGIRDMGALLRELAADGVAVLVSSHQISEVEDVCDTFTVLRRGAVVWDGTVSRLREEAPVSAYRLRTTDDDRAEALAHERRSGSGSGSLTVRRHPSGGLEIRAAEPALDGYTLALAAIGIAVRRLELTVSPLETVFFALTESAA